MLAENFNAFSFDNCAKHTNNSPLQGSFLLASLFLRNAHAVWGCGADGVLVVRNRALCGATKQTGCGSTKSRIVWGHRADGVWLKSKCNNALHTNICQLHDILMANKLTISTAESCSGGLLATLLSDAAGSSAYFIGSVVAYSDRVKIDVLGVPEDTIHDYGAVSEQAALAMLSGAYQLFHTDICCSITGIAGPNGGSTDKPVGTVYIGVKYQSINTVTRYTFAGDRDQIRHSAVEKAMTMILDMIKGV